MDGSLDGVPSRLLMQKIPKKHAGYLFGIVEGLAFHLLGGFQVEGVNFVVISWV
jgi:hypothetical protein